MNESLLLALGMAIWIGILTSISPCPLATNITALSFLSRDIKSPQRAFVGAIAYVLGRSLAYVCIAYLLAIGLISLSRLSFFLQLELGKIIGPMLIVLGVLLIFELFPGIYGPNITQQTGERLKRAGILGSFIFGIIFALAFCPVSAALFFGTLIPLSVKYSSPVTLPVAYGIGTGLPVLAISLLLAYSINQVGLWLKRLEEIEKIARKGTAIIFILAGLALTWAI